MNPLIRLRKTTPIFLVALVCFGLLPAAQALLPPPPPDGGYPGANTAEGTRALFNLTTGTNNTATGFEALFRNTTGSRNTANGSATLHENTDGISNTATGNNALHDNQTGSQNTATGAGALRSNTTGSHNTAHGFQALVSNQTSENTAVGFEALRDNDFGSDNTAVGAGALRSNAAVLGLMPSRNTAVGVRALEKNQASGNTAMGFEALHNMVFGEDNTAVGEGALRNNADQFSNTAVGAGALSSSFASGNTALGAGAGSNVIGAANVICIGTPGADVDDSCFIGNIRDVQTANANAIPVLIDSAGQLGTQSSSRRFKHDIKPMDKASEAILALKPVTFHYKSDNTNTPQFGLVAEEVAEVNPDLVVRDKNGDIYTVRYDQVNAMLLNEFLKEHRVVQELEKDLRSTIAQQQKQIEALTMGLQKVSAQLEANKPAPQVANNP